MAHVFISYSTDNAEFARYLRHLLQDSDFDVWMDEIGLSIGERWEIELKNKITDCVAFVIIMSPESEKSEWVQRELLLAEHLHKPIFPVLYSGDVFWKLATIQYEDMKLGTKVKQLTPRFVEALRSAVRAQTQATSTVVSPFILEASPPNEPLPSEKKELEQHKIDSRRRVIFLRCSIYITLIVLVIGFLATLIEKQINSPATATQVLSTAMANALTRTANWLTIVAVATEYAPATPSPTSTSTATPTVPTAIPNTGNLTANWQTVVAVATNGATPTPLATSTSTATAIVPTPTPDAVNLTANWQTVVAVATAVAMTKAAP